MKAVINIGGFICIGIIFILMTRYIFSSYREIFLKNKEKVMLIDMFFALFISPWSAPLVLATLFLYIGFRFWILVFLWPKHSYLVK